MSPFGVELEPLKQRVVRRGRRDPFDQPLHRRRRRHLLQSTPQRVDRIELIRPEELLFAARAARADVERRENSFSPRANDRA